MSWKKALLGLVGVVFAALLVTVAYGYTLPTDWHVERSVEVAAIPSDFHAFVDTPGGWDRWLTPPASGLKSEPFGPESGVGAGHSWQGQGTYGRMEITESSPDLGIGYSMTMEESETPATGTIHYRVEGDRTRITWQDNGDFQDMPLGGFMVEAMEKQLGAHMEAALGILKMQAEDEHRAALAAAVAAGAASQAEALAAGAPAVDSTTPPTDIPAPTPNPADAKMPPDAARAAKLVPALHP
jgi:hypothetical protein